VTRTATLTVNRPRDVVERAWASADLPEARFADAPGDRGTEIRIPIGTPPAGKVGEAVQKIAGNDPSAKAMDDLRRFKAKLETGVVPRSEGTPQGELAEAKLKQRPAQPLGDDELKEVGVE
jgi:uncharacterized membrane protein